MTEGISEREQRQYALMRQRLEAFREGGLAIGPVIADLEGLVYALEETPQEWKDQFMEEWAVLEIAYAVALDRVAPLPDAHDHDVASALDAMEALLRVRP